MSNGAQEDNIAAIRQLLLAAFTAEEFRRFCHDRPDFRLVVRRFSPRHSLADMADELITYCENFLLFPELLAELQQHNPRQYARYIEPEPSKAEPALSTPEVLTIDSPILLYLVRVPAGEFQMGSVMARDKYAQDEELPPHPVHLPEFHIGKYPVTNTQYQIFARVTGHRAPDYWENGRIFVSKSNHPVVNVSWEDALAFCAWLSRESGQPVRLPTEAEWEKAARGTDGRIYPWGDEPPDEERCNFGQDWDRGDTTTIGRYSPQGDSPYGCADMAGNVSEWCQSFYRPYPYQAGDVREVMEAAGTRAKRGGAFDGAEWEVRCAARSYHSQDGWNFRTGFRVCVAARQE
ncbi:MAG: SUMF1/EgtB/PvdO family nonheme iron enzyme [Anaerolineae bacterium]|jgi:formylglycine-generating enzyme required for sulfatase activity